MNEAVEKFFKVRDNRSLKFLPRFLLTRTYNCCLINYIDRRGRPLICLKFLNKKGIVQSGIIVVENKELHDRALGIVRTSCRSRLQVFDANDKDSEHKNVRYYFLNTMSNCEKFFDKGDAFDMAVNITGVNRRAAKDMIDG